MRGLTISLGCIVKITDAGTDYVNGYFKLPRTEAEINADFAEGGSFAGMREMGFGMVRYTNGTLTKTRLRPCPSQAVQAELLRVQWEQNQRRGKHIYRKGNPFCVSGWYIDNLDLYFAKADTSSLKPPRFGWEIPAGGSAKDSLQSLLFVCDISVGHFH